jgi:hypothetical protein
MNSVFIHKAEHRLDVYNAEHSIAILRGNLRKSTYKTWKE